MSEEKQPISEAASASKANDIPKTEDSNLASNLSAPEAQDTDVVDKTEAGSTDTAIGSVERTEAESEASEVSPEPVPEIEATSESSDGTAEPVEHEETPLESSETASKPVDETEVPAKPSDAAVESVEHEETPLESSDAVAESPNETEASVSEETSDEKSPDSEETDVERPRIGYTGEILGEVIPLSSLDAQQQATEEDRADADELVKLIDSSLSKVSQDEIVAGRVISIGEKDVVIDIGFKSDGIISRSEFGVGVKIGDEVEVYLERLENYHGQLVLSKDKAEQVRRWERVEEAYKNGTVLEGVIFRRIKGGMLVNLIDGLEAFLPGSQIDMRPVRDFDAYLDRKMQFKIVKINVENENVVVSHKALIERELASQRESILSTMETGQVLEGIAKNITDFGVFVDLGGVDGLLHITDLTWGRVSHPTEIVSLDEELKVVVLDYDKERQRISLGLKQLQPHPWENIEERYKPGDIVEGKVVSITDYGAFLEIEQGIEGLVHVSEMSWTGHIRHPSQRVSLGQMVKVSVLSIDHDTKKISLGMKQFEINPWEGIATRYPPGTVLRGRVRNITHFGAFVEIEPGIDGLVHVSDLSWTKTIRHPSELIKKRQELAVVVLDVDEKRQRIALGHKQIETNPWTNLASVYETGSDHKAKVVRIDRNGLTVELPLEVEAFVPGSELKKSQEGGFPPYQEGDELDLRVIRLDADQREIVMSETARKRQEEARARQKDQKVKRDERREEEKAIRRHVEREKVASGPTTIGELSGLESLKEKMEKEEQETSKAEASSIEVSDSTPETAEPDTSGVEASEEATPEESVTETLEVDGVQENLESEEVLEAEAPEEVEEAPEVEVSGEAEEVSEPEASAEPEQAQGVGASEEVEEVPEVEASAESERTEEVEVSEEVEEVLEVEASGEPEEVSEATDVEIPTSEEEIPEKSKAEETKVSEESETPDKND